MGVLGVRVRVHAPEHDVLVVLSEAEGPLSLPIVIGPHEGVAIATAQAGMQSPRPGPHDLLLSVLEASEVGLDRVNIIEVRDGTFIAELVLTNGRRVDSRASDAIALALRAHVEVWCAEAVLDVAAVVLDVDEDDHEHVHLGAPMHGQEADEEVAEFREFLDSVAPEDFDDSGA
ncbi:bifunctional nuclease family protein [Occultella glacieicola]|nr:bifunctional nuclease family protein [Occultella glacieicola]